MRRLLIDLAVDPFDDVREAASALLTGWASRIGAAQFLENVPSHIDKSSSQSFILDGVPAAHQRAERLMIETSRADLADGAGRLLRLSATYPGTMAKPKDLRPNELLSLAIDLLEADINIAMQDIRYAVSKAPLHGRLVAVR